MHRTVDLHVCYAQRRWACLLCLLHRIARAVPAAYRGVSPPPGYAQGFFFFNLTRTTARTSMTHTFGANEPLPCSWDPLPTNQFSNLLRDTTRGTQGMQQVREWADTKQASAKSSADTLREAFRQAWGISKQLIRKPIQPAHVDTCIAIGRTKLNGNVFSQRHTWTDTAMQLQQ